MCGVKTDGSVACWGNEIEVPEAPPGVEYIALASGDRDALVALYVSTGGPKLAGQQILAERQTDTGMEWRLHQQRTSNRAASLSEPAER